MNTFSEQPQSEQPKTRRELRELRERERQLREQAEASGQGSEEGETLGGAALETDVEISSESDSVGQEDAVMTENVAAEDNPVISSEEDHADTVERPLRGSLFSSTQRPSIYDPSSYAPPAATEESVTPLVVPTSSPDSLDGSGASRHVGPPASASAEATVESQHEPADEVVSNLFETPEDDTIEPDRTRRRSFLEPEDIPAEEAPAENSDPVIVPTPSPDSFDSGFDDEDDDEDPLAQFRPISYDDDDDVEVVKAPRAGFEASPIVEAPIAEPPASETPVNTPFITEQTATVVEDVEDVEDAEPAEPADVPVQLIEPIIAAEDTSQDLDSAFQSSRLDTESLDISDRPLTRRERRLLDQEETETNEAVEESGAAESLFEPLSFDSVPPAPAPAEVSVPVVDPFAIQAEIVDADSSDEAELELIEPEIIDSAPNEQALEDAELSARFGPRVEANQHWAKEQDSEVINGFNSGYDEDFDNRIGTTSGSTVTPKTLIEPSFTHDIAGPLNSTGEIILTGTIPMSQSFSETGSYVPIDSFIDEDDHDSDATFDSILDPMRASDSISALSSQNQVSMAPIKSKRMSTIVMASLVSVSGVAAIGLLIWAAVTFIF